MKQFFSWIWSFFLDAFEGIADFVRAFIEDFKESNRYFKIKMGLISGYVAISLVTIIVFIPPGELNQIDAEVHISKTEIVGGKYFLVRNVSSDTWQNIVITMNDSYATEWPKLRPGKKKAYFFNRFKDERNKTPDEELRVTKLRIDCSEGSFERDYTKKR
ncbi:MAG: hypothetical protein JRJ19_10635 [Deltaproteobacteria bacterium]|nr:hypothetical protein [Deltaproteobacteria bacterium]MBW1872514.1 hypothetical protein [Deltaproteobacteria bacterium]